MLSDDECNGRHTLESRLRAAALALTKVPEPNSISTLLVLMVRQKLCLTTAEALLFGPERLMQACLIIRTHVVMKSSRLTALSLTALSLWAFMAATHQQV
jgi:hypothetical protein